MTILPMRQRSRPPSPPPTPVEAQLAVWEYARRRRCRALRYLQQLHVSRGSTRRGILQLGRALRAVDSRLKAEWIQWAEESNKDQTPLVDYSTRGRKVVPTYSAARCGLRRRHLRAWCNEAWHFFRPRTNADVFSLPEKPPVSELVFLNSILSEGRSALSAHRDERLLLKPTGTTTNEWERGRAAVVREETTTENHICRDHRPVLVPCLRSSSASPSMAESLASEKTNSSAKEDHLLKTLGGAKLAGIVSTDFEKVDNHAKENESSWDTNGTGKKVENMVLASIRPGDWILPKRFVGVGGGRGVKWRGGGGDGWMRVEVVSVGKESLILASQGTGGATMPHRRASLTLSELSPARLPGALVVRQVLRRNTVGRTEAEVGKREGGEETEAFRLPVLSAEWGMGLLRQWARDDTALKTLEKVVPLQEALPEDPNWLLLQPVSSRGRTGENEAEFWRRGGRSQKTEKGDFACQGPTTEPKKEPVDASSSGFDDDEIGRRTISVNFQDKKKGLATKLGVKASGIKVCGSTKPGPVEESRSRGVRLAAPAGEKGLALRWARLSARDMAAVDLFTPGRFCRDVSNSQWTALYRGIDGECEVKGLEPCHRYRFRIRITPFGKRGGLWRHASFCTIPAQPEIPEAASWTSGVSTRLFRPASSSETVSGGNYRSREVHHDRLTTPYEDGVWDLQLKLKGGSNMGVDEDIAFVEALPGDYGSSCTWIVDRRAQQPRGQGYIPEQHQTALEWASECKVVNDHKACLTDRESLTVSTRGDQPTQAGDGKGDMEFPSSKRDDKGQELELPGTSWKRIYRGRKAECVAWSIPQGTECVFRCAMENADGLVGLWSEKLRCVAPPFIPRNIIDTAAARSTRATHHCIGDPIKNIYTTNNLATRPLALAAPPHVDLLVPALVEAFACLVDDGNRRIAAAIGGLESPPPPPSSTVMHPVQMRDESLSDGAKVDQHNLGGVNYTDSCASESGRACQSETPRQSLSASEDISPITVEEELHKDAQGRMEGAKSEEKEKRRAVQAQNRGDTHVWEEHWDADHHAPYFRLRGQDLSLWHIPVF